MSGMHALADPNHLPWLDDVRARSRKEAGPLPLIGLALGSVIAAAAIGVWLGQRASDVAAPSEAISDRPSLSVRLPAIDPSNALTAPPKAAPPDAQPAVAPPAVMPAPVVPPPVIHAQPVVRPVPHPLVRPAVRTTARNPARALPAKLGPTATATGAQAAPPAPPRRSAWPQPAAALGLGRVIRLSKYSSRDDVRLGWQSLQRNYPQLVGLPDVTVANRDARGRLFYRLHIVTTAKAQSEWLCNRLQRDLRHCTVLGTTDL